MARAKGPCAITLVLGVALLFASPPAYSEPGSGTFKRALAEANEGNLEKSIELWTRVIARNPKSYAAHANRGAALLWTGHVLRGVVDWHRARDLSPLFAFGDYNSRFIPETTSNSEMLNYAMSIELDPDYTPSVLMMAIAYLDFGRVEEAVSLYRKSIDLTKNPFWKNCFEHWIESLGFPTQEPADKR